MIQFVNWSHVAICELHKCVCNSFSSYNICPDVIRSKRATNFYTLGLSHSQYQTLSAQLSSQFLSFSPFCKGFDDERQVIKDKMGCTILQ